LTARFGRGNFDSWPSLVLGVTSTYCFSLGVSNSITAKNLEVRTGARSPCNRAHKFGKRCKQCTQVLLVALRWFKNGHASSFYRRFAMRIKSSNPARPRGWGGIRRIFRRGRGEPHRGAKSASKSLLVDHETEPTTDASITTHSQACPDTTFQSPGCPGDGNDDDAFDRCCDGAQQNAGDSSRPILDRLSVLELSQSHLEVSLLDDEREGLSNCGQQGGLACRTAVLDLEGETGLYDPAEEAGAEIVLTTSVVHPNSPETIERRAEREAKTMGGDAYYAHGRRDAPMADASVVHEMFESRWVSEATVTSSKGYGVPRVSIITTATLPPSSDDLHSHREEDKPSSGQGSDHSPSSDTLTWVSHDQHCALADTRPLKEISFTMLTDASESGSIHVTNGHVGLSAAAASPAPPAVVADDAVLSPSVTGSRPSGDSHGAATITSLQGNMRVRDAIFASFDAGNDATKAAARARAAQLEEAGGDPDSDHKSGEAYSQLLQWPDPGVEDSPDNPAKADAARPRSGDNKSSDSIGDADDSTLSSSRPDDPSRGLSAYALEPADDPPPPGQLIPVSSSKRCHASAFDAVAVLRSPSFDAGLSHLAYKAMQICGEKSASGPGDIDTIRKSLSLMDALSEDDESDQPDGENTDHTPTETASSGSGLSRCSLPRQLSIPNVDASSKKATPPLAPRVLIREISTGTEGEESSVASESLTAGSNSHTFRSSSSGRSTLETIDDEGNEYSSSGASTRESRDGSSSSQTDGNDTRLKEYQSATEGEDDEFELEMGEYGALVPRCLYA
jgi:hypothetical protein